MTPGRPSEILRQLEERTTLDRELLSRYIHERDQAAFADIVRAHGSLVLGVCRRMTGHFQDAEDAFQAVFLVLASKATTIKNPNVLGGWLYGVAVRVARKARRSVARRRRCEVSVAVLPEPVEVSKEAVSDLLPIVDEELAILPDYYRDAIVLCDLQGVSREAAALTLGVPAGTLSSRLANGRKKLALRLSKRGIAISAAAITEPLSALQAARVPSELQMKTCGMVAKWLARGTMPSPLARLTEGGLAVRKTVLLGLFLTTVVVVGALYAGQWEQSQSGEDLPGNKEVVQTKPPMPSRAASDSKLKRSPIALSDRPKLREAIDLTLSETVAPLVWNPRGTQIALTSGIRQQLPGNKGVRTVCVFNFDVRIATYLQVPSNSTLIGFTPDGSSIITETQEPHLVSGVHKLDVWEKVSTPLNLGGGKPGNERFRDVLRSINLDATTTQCYAFAADEKTFRTVVIEQDPGNPEITSLEVEELDAATGSKLKSLLKVSAETKTRVQTLSPDGKRFAVFEKANSLVVYDVERGSKISSTTFKPVEYIQTAVKVKLAAPYEGECYGVERESETTSIGFSADGGLLVVSRAIGFTSVIDTRTGKAIPVDGIANLRLSMGSSPFSPDGRLLALNADSYVNETLVIGLPTQGDKINPPGRYWNKHESFLLIWDTTTGKAIKRWNIDPAAKAAFSPVKPILAVAERNGTDTRLGLWDFQAE